MTGHRHHDHGPAAAGRDLAELADQLRLAVGDGPAGTAPAWAGRFAAAAAVWRRVGGETGLESFAALADGLAALAAALGEVVPLDTDLAARLMLLDDGLAALLERYDAGEDGPRLAAVPAWSALVLDGGAAGDGEPAAPAAPAVAGPVVILVAGPFLRDLLASRLEAAGLPALAVAAPEAVPPLLAGPRPPTLVLCDNAEPTAHLRRLRRLLAAAPGPRPALVLVDSAGETGPGRERRVRTTGADGVWPEPWRPDQLPGFVAPGGTS